MRFVTGGACQGKHTFVRERFPGEICITVEEEQILQSISAGQDMVTQIELQVSEASRKGNQIVVIMNETGSGITPMEARQRRLRDEMGRIGCALAAEAEEVYRVVAGIGIRIK